MAHQLVYTSAARLLDAGRSGFGTVARSKTISPLLVSAIERVSQFSNIRGTERSRVIYVHRRMVAGSNRFHILSRIADAGADYTGRTNHIAHHLIVTQEEVARAASMGITPADVLTQFPWLSRWEGNARFLTPEEDVNLTTFQPIGRQSARSGWAGMTGNPSHARLLAWDGAPRNGILLLPVHADPLAMLAEALAEFGSQSWSKAFTTSLETTDELSELDWIIATPATFPEIQRRCGNRAILDLTQPQSLPVPPEPVQETRKIPAPDLTTRTEPTIARNMPEPDIRTGAAQVRVGSRAGEQRRQSPSKPAARPKQTVPIIVASAAAVLAVVILGIAVLKSRDPKPKDGEATAVAPAFSGIQEKALSDLKRLGIAEDDAKKIVIGANDDSSAWVDYIKGVIQTVKNSDPTMHPSWPILHVTKEPDGSPVWLSSLVAAGYQWVEVLEKPAPSTDFAGKLNEIDNISKALTEYSVATNTATGEMQLDEKVISTFVKTQIRREFGKLLGVEQAPLSQEVKDQLLSAIRSGNLSYQNFPKRYDILVEVISERFETIKSTELLAALKETVGSSNPDDLNGLEQALNLWNKPEPAAGEDIQKSRFVPDNYEDLRQAHLKSSPDSLVHNDGGGQAKKEGGSRDENTSESGPDLTGVKQKQIIIVSAQKLKEEGVEVDLLKKILKFPVTEWLGKGLKITIGEQDVKELSKGQGDFYAENFRSTKSDGKFKIHPDGKISLNPILGTVIHFSMNSEGISTSIIIDDETNEPIAPPSNFRFNQENEDKVIITGEIAEILNSIKYDKKLKIVIKGNHAYTLEEVGNKFGFQRQAVAHPTQDYIFSKNDSNEIKETLRAWLESKEKPHLDQLKLVVEKAIGGILISNELKKTDFKIEDHSKICDAYKKILNKKDKDWVIYTPNKKPDDTKIKFDQEVLEIKKEVGKEELDKILNKMNLEGWDKAMAGTPNRDTIETYITSILKAGTKRPEIPSFMEQLKDFSEITIQTTKGRVLFKATRQP